jgi:hypothetical protein
MAQYPRRVLKVRHNITLAPIFFLTSLDTGLRAARIKIIFTLPSHLGQCSGPLVYVDWFRPFRTRDSKSHMFKLQWSTVRHQHTSSIIFASQIVQDCHLIPLVGQSSTWPDGLSSETALDCCTEFLFNHYLNPSLFARFEFQSQRT